MADQETSARMRVLATQSLLLSIRLGAAVTSGQTLTALETLLTFLDNEQAKTLQRLESRIEQLRSDIGRLEDKADKTYLHVVQQMEVDYKAGYDLLREALQTKNSGRRKGRIEKAKDCYTRARYSVPFPLEVVNAIIYIGICHYFLGEMDLAHNSFLEARKAIVKLQDELRLPNNPYVVIDDSFIVLAERQFSSSFPKPPTLFERIFPHPPVQMQPSSSSSQHPAIPQSEPGNMLRSLDSLRDQIQFLESLEPPRKLVRRTLPVIAAVTAVGGATAFVLDRLGNKSVGRASTFLLKSIGKKGK